MEKETNKSKFKNWLITRKWLWKKVVFDNGVVGSHFHRYDHRIFSYSQGMGDNGEHGDVTKAIQNQLTRNQLMDNKYYKCVCGSENFIRMYNVWNEKIKVKISEYKGEESWSIEERGKEKDHLYGIICAECRQDATDLNDGL